MDDAGAIAPRTLQLAGQIIEIARDEGASPGDRLYEHRLAQRLGISRGPVRAALQALAEAGLTGTIPNRGFVLLKPLDSEAARSTLDAASLTERQYMAIVKDRLEGRLADTVSEAELMRRYDLRRTALLRLLDRIAAEGWVERSPGYGWRFMQTLSSPDTYAQTGRLRMMIEPGGILEPTFHLEKDALERVRTQQERLLAKGPEHFTIAETFRFGCEFHETIAEASGNPFLLDTLRRTNRIRRLFAYNLLPDVEFLSSHTREHLKLLDLLESGRRQEAAELMRQHLWWSGGGNQLSQKATTGER